MPRKVVCEMYYDFIYDLPIIKCCVVALAGNYASQRISGVKLIDIHSLAAYGVYGLLFGGTIPHFFYSFLEYAVPDGASFPVARKLILERLVYSPLYQAFALYMIARLEGKDHKTAVEQLRGLYWTVLTTSWKYLTVLQLLNVSIVPPMLRVLVVNLIGFFWIIYLANQRRQQELAKSK
ncbi:peroxisomal membrane protein 2 isoform X2 [Anthonomus grandis grandis]|uniref:peroxisomal membrane protein 2 isoform X2 n=1 Tax=Anthonomus grandis grandis TaxID=2921223 RepID=UPI002166487A|nr:peroxisomal membrane protein 2 isoform X2 [Anthonomus grandis grandis]